MRLRYSYTLIIILAAQAHAYDSFGARIHQILFGPIWSYQQVCGTHQDPKRLLRDDELSEALFNGSSLLELSRSGSNGYIKKANKLIYDSIIARNSLCMSCSENSWSYADKHLEDLSNPTKQDRRDCECRIDKLLEKVSNVTTPDRYIDSFATAHQCSNIDQDDDFINQMNSFGRVPPGRLYFNELWLGDYDTCTRMQSMRYCLGSYKSHDWVSLSSGRDDFRGIRIGLCLPRTCGSELISDKRILRKINTIVQSNLVDVQGFKDPNEFFLEDVYCLPTVDSQWMSFTKDYMSIFLLLMIIVWVKLLTYATVVKPSNVLQAFDLNRQVASFFEHKQSREYLSVIEPIKVISMLAVMNSHSFAISQMFYMRNINDIGNYDIATLLTYLAGPSPVNFYLISGLLAGLYHLQKEQNPVRSIIYRYLRLAPMYIIIYAYVKKFRHAIGSGPLWDYAVSPQSETRQCMRESWLVPVLMLSNMLHPFNHCIDIGSNVSNDFHIYLLLLLLFCIYRKSRRIGRLVVILSLLISLAFRVWYYSIADNIINRNLFSQTIFFGSRYVAFRMVHVYINPIGRFGAYFLGALLADLLIESWQSKPEGQYDYQASYVNQQVKLQVEMSDQERASNNGSNLLRWFRSRHLLLIGLFFAAAQTIFPILPDAYKRVLYPSYLKGVAYPLSVLSLELGSFLIMYHFLIKLPAERANLDKSNRTDLQKSTTTQRRGCVERFFGSRYWRIAAKLDYCVMLLHFEVIRYLVQTHRELPAYSTSRFLTTSAATTIVSYSIGFIIHLTIEMPIRNLLTSLIIRSQSPQK